MNYTDMKSNIFTQLVSVNFRLFWGFRSAIACMVMRIYEYLCRNVCYLYYIVNRLVCLHVDVRAICKYEFLEEAFVYKKLIMVCVFKLSLVMHVQSRANFFMKNLV